MLLSVVGALAGLTSTAIRTALGTSSWSSPSRLVATSWPKKLMPVALPPGRARLATRPSLTGSSPTPKTIGIVVVAVLAASEAGLLPGVAITATRTADKVGHERRQAVRIGRPASGTPPPHFDPRRSRFRLGPYGMQRQAWPSMTSRVRI